MAAKCQARKKFIITTDWIAAEPKELTVVTVDGNIDLSTLAELGGQFGIPQIPTVNQNKKGKE